MQREFEAPRLWLWIILRPLLLVLMDRGPHAVGISVAELFSGSNTTLVIPRFLWLFIHEHDFPKHITTIPGHVPLPFVSLINQLQLASTREILILIGLYNGVMGDGLLLLCEMIRSRWPYSFMIDDGFGSRAADFVDLYFEVSIIFDIVWCHTRRIKIW